MFRYPALSPGWAWAPTVAELIGAPLSITWLAWACRSPCLAGLPHTWLQHLPARRITLRVLTALPVDDDVLVEPHRLGGKQQFETWVRESTATRR